MKIVESFTGFQPLEEVWIGGTYPTNFYNDLPSQVQDTFGKISEQTEKGFDALEKKLKELGVVVRKPVFTQDKENYKDDFGNLIKPPVCPRDWAITVGNQLWIIPQGYKVEPYQHVIDEYRSTGAHVEILDRGSDSRAWLGFPGMVRLGEKIIVDTGYEMKNSENKKHILKAVEYLKGLGYHVVLTSEGGHLDSVFCPIKDRHIFSSHWGEQNFYNKTFPGWEVFWIKTEKNSKGNGMWWTAENNFFSPIFNDYIDKKAKEWVGDSTETVFEANILVIDEKNIICIAEHKQSFKKMEQLGITPHVVDFPARHFWDGGIHCITVDIRRSGGCKEYFNG
jgi:hypothetical protein